MKINPRARRKQYAMYFGAYLGIYMILKFILFPLTFIVPLVSLLYIGLLIAVPFIVYYYLRTYRDKICGGSIKFGTAYFFSLQVFFYGALLTSVAHFVYFQFIDNGFVMNHLMAQINMLREDPAMEQHLTSLDEVASTFGTLSARDITFNFLSSNLTFGIFLSFPIALFAKKAKH